MSSYSRSPSSMGYRLDFCASARRRSRSSRAEKRPSAQPRRSSAYLRARSLDSWPNFTHLVFGGESFYPSAQRTKICSSCIEDVFSQTRQSRLRASNGVTRPTMLRFSFSFQSSSSAPAAPYTTVNIRASGGMPGPDLSMFLVASAKACSADSTSERAVSASRSARLSCRCRISTCETLVFKQVISMCI